jgi:hypothetical protein
MVKTINIGGKERPVYFGWNALAIFEEKTGIGLSDIGDAISAGMTTKVFIDFVYAGLVGGVKKTKSEHDFTSDDVGDWLDDYGVENMGKISEIYMEAMPMVKDDKKKETKPKPKK